MYEEAKVLQKSPLIERLPRVRGRYTLSAPLAPITWFRVGGPAEVLYKPADVEDLCYFLKEKPAEVPVTFLGVGSNILVRDGGVPGVVIRLGQHFNHCIVEDETIDVGSAVLDRNLALLSQTEGIGGLEFFCGIPGTIGGALRMNAGAYGSEIKDVLLSALAIDGKGNLKRLTLDECQFSYRACGIPKEWIFIGATLKGYKANPADIETKIHSMLVKRDETQPVKARTGGSTFANPSSHHAWELIDRAGCRGLQMGGAQVSEKHCNFLINTGQATAADLENLGEEVRRRVMDLTGVELRWEIQRIGIHQTELIKRADAA